MRNEGGLQKECPNTIFENWTLHLLSPHSTKAMVGKCLWSQWSQLHQWWQFVHPSSCKPLSCESAPQKCCSSQWMVRHKKLHNIKYSGNKVNNQLNLMNLTLGNPPKWNVSILSCPGFGISVCNTRMSQPLFAACYESQFIKCRSPQSIQKLMSFSLEGSLNDMSYKGHGPSVKQRGWNGIVNLYSFRDHLHCDEWGPFKTKIVCDHEIKESIISITMQSLISWS